MGQRATGDDPAGSASPAIDPLDVRILELSLEGLVSAEIAARVGLSTQTVQRRLRAVARTLGASSKVEAIFIARRRGLIGRAEP